MTNIMFDISMILYLITWFKKGDEYYIGHTKKTLFLLINENFLLEHNYTLLIERFFEIQNISEEFFIL